jgi:hypothetical protein
MGMDFEIVAYRGKPLSTAEIANVVARFTPYADLFRHSTASELKKPLVPDLHCIAFYEQVDGDSDDEDEDDDTELEKPHLPSSATASAPKVFASDALLEAARGADGSHRSLASVIQAAWSHARATAPTRDDASEPRRGEPAVPSTSDATDESDCPGLAREISRIRGEAFLIGYGDHSCIGIYAHFRNGELVSPDSVDNIYAERDDYTSWPAKQLSAALGKQVETDQLAQLYFPDARKPPLYKVERAKRAIAFDPDRYMMGLSESI